MSFADNKIPPGGPGRHPEEPHSPAVSHRLLPGVSGQEYKAIFENSSDAILLLDEKRRIVSCNRAFYELFGYIEDEVMGASVQLIHPSDESFLRFGINAYSVIQSENAFRTEWTFSRRDGTLVPVETVTSAIRSGEGIITGYLAIIRDITERKKAEKALRESEIRYRTAIEHSNDGVAVLSGAIHVYANHRLAEIFGYDSYHEIIGKPVTFLAHPDDRDRVALNVETRQNLGPAPSRYEFRGIRKDGTTVYVEVSVTTIAYHGKQNILSYVRDVTKRKLAEVALKESEEKYRLLIQNAIESIFVVQDGRVKFPNPRMLEKFGYLKEELERLPFAEHIHPEDKHLVEEHHRKRLHGEESASTYSLRIVTKSGEILWGELNTVDIEWEGGPATLNFLRDITEQKKLESQFLQAQKMEAIGTLAGGIAHDFNNLLMVVQGYASLMLSDVAPGHPHYEMLRQIEEQVKSGSGLTKQLLGFARGGRYEIKPTDLNDIVLETSTMFGRTKKEIVIHCTCEQGLRTVEVDRGQMEQVLLNLYVNAWQAMPTGGDLYVGTRNVTLDRRGARALSLGPGKYVKTIITDTGVGMDRKTRERIFEPFFTTKEMGRGTGLGLASAYGIIKGHGGTIDVLSEPGVGTTFEIYLPASQLEPVKTDAPSEKTFTGTETILLIDDEEAILHVSADILKALGYTVIPVESAREAIDIYSRQKDGIDLVILDMIMPEMSGGETFAFLKMINPGVRAILSSGYSLNDQAEKIMKQGCQAFIEKPFTIQSLSMKVREVLDGRA